MTDSNINEKNVLIVGSSSSIGNEISILFRKASMRVITTYTSTQPKNVYGQSGSDILHLDLRDDESIESFSQRLKKIISSIDIAIFLAGILPGKNLEEYELLDIDEVMAINFNGQAKLVMKMLPLFTSKSRLLLFSSISAQRGSYDPIYAASKGAILSFVKSLARGLPPGMSVNSIAPGLIQDSRMFDDMAIERQNYHRNQVPSKELLCSEDLAKIVFDLCQEHWKHLNGACIDINGGQSVR